MCESELAINCFQEEIVIFLIYVIHFETPSSKWEVKETYSPFQDCQDPAVQFPALLWQVCENWEVPGRDWYAEDRIPEWGWEGDDKASSTNEVHLGVEGKDIIPEYQCAGGWGNPTKIEGIAVTTGIAGNRRGSSLLFAGWRIKTIKLEWGGMDQ